MPVNPQKAELDQTCGCATQPAPLQPLNPCELEIDLFCKGMRVDSSCALEEDAWPVQRTRAGLGSGLELIIPGGLKDVWVNVPVEEAFARRSCYRLIREAGAYWVVDERQGFRYTVRLSPEPAWYERMTSRGAPMHRIGVLSPFPPCVFSGQPSARLWRVFARLVTQTCEWRSRMFTTPVDGTTSPWT